MDSVKLIESYFPDLSAKQKQQFELLGTLYAEWNSKINVISRKDIEALYERHILHSLGIAMVYSFSPSDKVLDVGTGGGFPGIPLAILFPETKFTLLDSIAKKIKVVHEISMELGLKNVRTKVGRAEEHHEQYNFIISRAVTRTERFLGWMKGKFLSKSNTKRKNGILYLKGGDLKEELSEIKKDYILYSLSDYFKEDFFETKQVLYIPF